MLLTVTLPLAYRGILAGVLLGFVRAVSEFGATIVVAGNIPGRTQTIPSAMFTEIQLGNDADNIRLFMRMRDLPKPNTRADVPTYILIPAFILHELTVAFKIGVLIFIPFVIIDMVVATTLISMGIIVLPPVLISLPFKLVLFVLVDGWDLLVMQLIESFR